MTQTCQSIIVSGQVQGVFYRAFARENAEHLGITGWAKNRTDGTVEILACGETEMVQKFIELLKEGPQFAKVTNVSTTETNSTNFTDFRIIYR